MNLVKFTTKLPEMKSLDDLMLFDKKYFEDNENDTRYARPRIMFLEVPNLLPDCHWTLVEKISGTVRMRSYFTELKKINMN